MMRRAGPVIGGWRGLRAGPSLVPAAAEHRPDAASSSQLAARAPPLSHQPDSGDVLKR